MNCTTPAYDTIYAPWLSHPETLLDLSRWRPEMTLLDLCGGTGAVSREAIRRGADPSAIVLYDLHPRAHDLACAGVAQVRGLAEQLDLPGHRFDRVVMRQAVAYLEPTHLTDTFRRIRDHLNPGGRFAFNAFVRPRVFLRRRGRHLEAGAYWGRTVWHLQTAGRLWDVSRFHWFTREELIDAVWSTSFRFLEEAHDEASLRFVCHV